MEILNQFGVQPVLLAAQVVNFLILLFILKKFLYKPILKVLDERKKRIEDSLKNAESIERKLAETEAQSEKILAKASADAQNFLDQANEAAARIREEAKQQEQQILLKAADDAKKIVELERENLMRQTRVHIGNLVAQVLEKVTGKKITPKDQAEIIDREVKNIS